MCGNHLGDNVLIVCTMSLPYPVVMFREALTLMTITEICLIAGVVLILVSHQQADIEPGESWLGILPWIAVPSKVAGSGFALCDAFQVRCL